MDLRADLRVDLRVDLRPDLRPDSKGMTVYISYLIFPFHIVGNLMKSKLQGPIDSK